MNLLRVIRRLLLCSGWTLVLVALWGMGQLIARWSRRRTRAWRGFIVNRWARGIARILGVRITRQGHPPAPPFCLVANHLSYLDIIVLHSQLRCLFVSKAEVKDWPVLGWLARTFGTLFINRRRVRDILRVQAEIEEALQDGDAVVFFPEGTTSKGDRVYPFRAALLDLPARLHLPVSHATLTYGTPPSAPPAHMAVCWWGDMPFAGHLRRLLELPRIEATVTFGEDALHDTDRRALATELHERVQRHFTPVVHETRDPA